VNEHTNIITMCLNHVVQILIVKDENWCAKVGGTYSKVKKVKCTLVQALRLCTGRTAHRESGGIALLFHDKRN
jgi:hypothetical protein